MKALRMMAVLGLLLVATTGVAQAKHRSERDITLSVDAAPSVLQFSGRTGQASYEAQEGVHNLLTRSTGAEVDHYYFWVEVNGQKVLAVDPIWMDYD